jgi:hypothetical protein
VDEDATPRPVIDRGSARALVSIAPTQDVQPDATEEDAPHSSRHGIITTAADVARKFRGDETPAEGVEAPAAGGKPKAEKPKPKPRRPGWGAVIVAMLAGGPTYTELREIFKDAFGKDEAIAEAKELGALEGRIDAQAEQITELRVKIASNTAGDIEAAYNGALEFRHFDGQLGALGRNINRLMDEEQIPASERSALTETPFEIVERHDQEIQLYRAARAKADRQAIERAVAEDDTVTGP